MLEVCVSDILNKFMMTKVATVADSLLAIVVDGLHNSHKVPEDQC